MNSSNYLLQALKGIKEVFENASNAMIDSLKDNRIIHFYDSSADDDLFTSTEGLTGISDLGEEETPPSLFLEDGYQVTLSPTRFGGAIVVPEKTYKIDKGDATTKIDKYLEQQQRKALDATKNKLLTKAFYMLNNAFSSSAATLAPDSVELCGVHTWASGGNFTNSATAALDADAIDDMEEYAGAFVDPTDTDQPFVHDFDTIVVKTGSDAARMAKKLFAFGITPISVADINIYVGEKTVVETPYITTTNKNYWFARATKYENSVVLGINQSPTLNEPIKQDNEAIRSNITAFAKRGLRNMPHDWYGSTGTT